jgi:uncharacterized membrane protein YvbJ
MKKCVHCGYENGDEVTFCEDCGKLVVCIRMTVMPKN